MPGLTLAEWKSRTGYLPPVLDSLAFSIVQDRGVGAANALAEAIVTVRDLSKTGRTYVTDVRLPDATREELRSALAEWEIMRAEVADPKLSDDEESELVAMLPTLERFAEFSEAAIVEARQILADGAAKLNLQEFDGELGDALAALVEERVKGETGGAHASDKLPNLPNKPGKTNWVEKAGGLPELIHRVAKHLMSEKGRSESTAIATAVNWAKKMCSSGRAFGGKVKVSPKAQAAACAAVAQWEAKRKGGSAREAAFNDALVRSADRMQHLVSPAAAQPRLAERHAHRATVIEGTLSGLTLRHPQLALQTAERLLAESGLLANDFDYSDPELIALAEAASVDLSPDGRRKLAAKGHAMKDGGYPIPNVEFLKKAISAFGRAKNKDAAKAWIVKRAKALGATNLLPDGWDVKEAARYASEMLERELAIERTLAEALGYARTPIRAKDSGHKGKFHGMHGVERAVRTRQHIPGGDEHPVLTAMGNGGLKEAPYTEQLHPRVSTGGTGAGEFASKGGNTAAAQQQPGGQGQAAGADRPVQEQLNERLQFLGYGQLTEFQQANGLPATGNLDAQTIDALRGAQPKTNIQSEIDQSLQFGASKAAAKGTSGTLAAQQRTQVGSDQLQSIGYADDHGGIAQFQKDYGMPITGQLDATTLASISNVYGNNARANSKVPDFTGIKGSGVKVQRGNPTPAEKGRKTIGKASVTKVKEAVDSLFEASSANDVGGMFDTSVYGGGTPIYPNPGQSGSRDDRQPGGDDIDLDEPPVRPPGLSEGDGTHVCATCVHFARGGTLIPHVYGACMMYTYPVDRLDVCDDWLTLSPDEANIHVVEGQLREAEKAGDTDAILIARERLATLRRRAAELGRASHPADKDLPGSVKVREQLTRS